MALIENYELTNPYTEYYGVDQLESEIIELTCQEQDLTIRGLFEQAEHAREHRAMAAEAIEYLLRVRR